MSIYFSASELLEIAIGIERNGAAFYQALADKTQDNDIKATYNYLADQENKHLELFQGMLGSIGQYKPPEAYAEEYMLYLKSLIDNRVFADPAEAQQKAEKISDAMEAIDMGLQAEKDSILFYAEMQNLVRESDRRVVHNVIEEEKRHVRRLYEIKATLKK